MVCSKVRSGIASNLIGLSFTIPSERQELNFDVYGTRLVGRPSRPIIYLLHCMKIEMTQVSLT